MGDDPPTLVDLFAGCGGLAKGFHQAGFSTVLANEIHSDPADTYRHNLLPDNPDAMIVGDVKKVLSDEVIERLGFREFDVDCVAGGPPCQGFSMAGRGNPDDPRNELFREFLRVVMKIKPKSVIFENVPGFGNRYGKGLRIELKERLEEAGYVVDTDVIKARDFGVPQLRRRFFCMGVHREYLSLEQTSLPTPTWSEKKTQSLLTSRQVLDDLDSYVLRGGYGTGEIDGPDRYLKPALTKFAKEMREVSGTTKEDRTWNTRIPMHTARVRDRMAALQKGATRQSLMGTELESLKLSQRVLHRDRFPNITVVSIPDDYVHYNTELPRTLSVRECARLQTFPDDFRFLGRRTTGAERRRTDVPQYTQVGNAVPPRLALEMGKSVLSHLGM